MDFPPEHTCNRYDQFGDQLPGHNDKWICFMCSHEVCINCYMRHNEKAHPEIYSTRCETCSSMTLYKDFVDYHWCVKCKPVPEGNHSCKDCRPWDFRK